MSKRIFIRGGSWFAIPNSLRSVNDHRWTAESEDNDLGFRVVQDAEYQVLRGGSWLNPQDFLRAAYYFKGSAWLVNYGFRVICDD